MNTLIFILLLSNGMNAFFVCIVMYFCIQQCSLSLSTHVFISILQLCSIRGKSALWMWRRVKIYIKLVAKLVKKHKDFVVSRKFSQTNLIFLFSFIGQWTKSSSFGCIKEKCNKTESAARFKVENWAGVLLTSVRSVWCVFFFGIETHFSFFFLFFEIDTNW